MCTGRSGSVTFYNVCKHIKNYTTGHESRKNLDIIFPDNHIEIDNRLSWFLGTLNENFGNDAIYVHLRRNKYEVAKVTLNAFITGEELQKVLSIIC